MVLGVPVFVVIYTLIKEGVIRRLRHNDLPVEDSAYMNLDYIDPVTLEPVHHREEESE
jgi:hypothetical protein